MKIRLELPDDGVRELETLMEQTGLSTKEDLLNNALTLFKWAVRERQSGRTIASVDAEHSRYKELLMPSLNAANERTDREAVAAEF